MPTEAQFQGLKFEDSRDYRGEGFREYLQPNTYEPITNFSGRGGIDELINENRLIALNIPYPLTTYASFSQQQIKDSQVSPNPIQFGTYTEETTILVYYWIDREQLATVYRIVPFITIDPDQLSDQETRTLLQDVLIWISETLGKAAAQAAQQGGGDDKQRLKRIIDWLKSRRIGKTIGLWIQSGRVVETLEDVTGVSFDRETNRPFGNRGKGDGVRGVPKSESKSESVNPLPYLISGLGIATGSPVVFGVGLLVSYLERNK
jgi:hypothetical protein